MNDVVFVISILIGFLFAFSLLWITIVFSISRLSGWAKLANQYPAMGRIDGTVFNWCSARFRYFSSYSNCLTVTVSPAGIHIRPLIFFSIGHDPIMIPRHAIIEITRAFSFVFPGMKLKIKSPDEDQITTIILYGRRLTERLEKPFAN